MCDTGTCAVDHLLEHHDGETDETKCFVCSAPMNDSLMGLSDDFTPIFAEVKLRRPINIEFLDPTTGPLPLTNITWAGAGVICTLPAAYLCLRYVDAVDLPIKMVWPRGSEHDAPSWLFG